MNNSSCARMRLESKNCSSMGSTLNFSMLNYDKSIINVCNNFFYQSLLDTTTTTSKAQLAEQQGVITHTNGKNNLKQHKISTKTSNNNSFHINKLLPELFDDTKLNQNNNNNTGSSSTTDKQPQTVLRNGSPNMFNSRLLPMMLPNKLDVNNLNASNAQSSITKMEKMFEKMTSDSKLPKQPNLQASETEEETNNNNNNYEQQLQRLNYIQNFLLLSKAESEPPLPGSTKKLNISSASSSSSHSSKSKHLEEPKSVDSSSLIFKCKSCDKCYMTSGALKMHIRTHTLPCKCKVCGKSFSRPWLLQGIFLINIKSK